MIRIVLLLIGAGATLAAALVYAEPTRLTHARNIVSTLLGEPAPDHAMRSVNVARDRNGDFALRARINGATTPMVMDTGATSVVLTYEAAKAAGLPTEFLDYSVSVETANGPTRAASVVLDRIAIGRVTEQAVPALVAPPGKLKVSLLGMSFLDRLESFEVSGDRVQLRFYR